MADSTSGFTVYVNNHCPACRLVTEYINQNALKCEVVNIDLEDKNPPVDLWVFPALFEDSRLLAYGEDIIERLQQKA